MPKAVEKLFEIGAEAKRNMGKETDRQLLKMIEENPGWTPYRLAQKLGWQVGRVDGSLRRLQKQGKVRVKQVLKQGRMVKKIYPLGYQPKHPSLVEIPLRVLDDSAAWLQKGVTVYALSRSSIGLSPDPIDSWEHKAWRKFRVKAERVKDSIQIKLPDEVVEFYGLWNSEIGLSTSRNEALLTVESAVIPLADEKGRSITR
jgi:predicted transcriptional regulator